MLLGAILLKGSDRESALRVNFHGLCGLIHGHYVEKHAASVALREETQNCHAPKEQHPGRPLKEMGKNHQGIRFVCVFSLEGGQLRPDFITFDELVDQLHSLGCAAAPHEDQKGVDENLMRCVGVEHTRVERKPRALN